MPDMIRQTHRVTLAELDRDESGRGPHNATAALCALVVLGGFVATVAFVGYHAGRAMARAAHWALTWGAGL